MTQGGSKFIKIKINIETGEVKVKDENNNKATELTRTEVEQKYQGTGTLESIGEILRGESNPVCYYVCLNSNCFMICF
jgi:hypothetical protein